MELREEVGEDAGAAAGVEDRAVVAAEERPDPPEAVPEAVHGRAEDVDVKALGPAESRVVHELLAGGHDTLSARSPGRA